MTIAGLKRRLPKRTLIAVALLAAALAVPLVAAPQERGRRLFPPEELGVLEGPDRDAWQKPDLIMDALGIGEGSVVADLGAGGGWFTVRLARRVGPNGMVYAQDVQSQMLEAIKRRVGREGLRNVEYVQGSLDDPRLPAGRFDAVLIVDAYHEVGEPITLLRNVSMSLKSTGRIGIVNFTLEGGGPGPPLNQRKSQESVINEARQAGLRLVNRVNRESFLEFQYMLIFGK
jgi:ubiquinone/menaquinone biosynthesis C-methylase UbiE